MTHRRLSVLLMAVLVVPLLATTACSSSAGPDTPAPAATSSSSPADRLGQMQKEVDAAEHAADAADANGNADN